MNLDFSWLTSSLAVGACFSPDALPTLKALRIRRVVDLRQEAVDDEAQLEDHGMKLLHLPTLDLCAVSRAMLDHGVLWVNRQLEGNHRVLIHCRHGIGRSALLALCVLVSRGLSPLEALRLTKQVRGKVSPNPEQLAAYVEWLEGYALGSSVRWALPRMDELMALAHARG